MNEGGGIFLLRKIRQNPLWNEKPFTRGQAWVDMLLLANYKDNDIFFEGQIYKIKRGQFIRSERQFAMDWGWSRSAVTRFLKLLKKQEMIVSKPNPRANLLTILNYNQLQKIRTNNRTSGEPVANLTKKEKKEKKERSKEKPKAQAPLILPDFINQQTWQDFKAHRQKLRKPMTHRAEELIISKLINFNSRGFDPNNILENSIANGWQGVFEPNETGGVKDGLEDFLHRHQGSV